MLLGNSGWIVPDITEVNRGKLKQMELSRKLNIVDSLEAHLSTWRQDRYRKSMAINDLSPPGRRNVLWKKPEWRWRYDDKISDENETNVSSKKSSPSPRRDRFDASTMSGTSNCHARRVVCKVSTGTWSKCQVNCGVNQRAGCSRYSCVIISTCAQMPR